MRFSSSELILAGQALNRAMARLGSAIVGFSIAAKEINLPTINLES